MTKTTGTLAQYPFISKKYVDYQVPLKSSFDAPFYQHLVRAPHAKRAFTKPGPDRIGSD